MIIFLNSAVVARTNDASWEFNYGESTFTMYWVWHVKA